MALDASRLFRVEFCGNSGKVTLSFDHLKADRRLSGMHELIAKSDVSESSLELEINSRLSALLPKPFGYQGLTLTLIDLPVHCSN